MATFKSQAILRANRFRSPGEGQVTYVPFGITIPSGTLIGASDVIRLGRIDPSKIIVTGVYLDISDNLDGHGTLGSRTLAGTLGLLRSANRGGTNLSTNAAGSAATEAADFLLTAAATPLVAGSVGSVTNFGGGAGVGQLASGGVAKYNTVVAALNRRGYDANVMDVAISMTAASSTATTADIVIACTLECFGVMTAPSSDPSYIYGMD